MIRRVKIQGYKSLYDLEVHLEPLSVLFGPNASGKSNFLDALQLLSRIATSRTLKEAFDPPHRGKYLESFSFGEHGIEDLLAKDAATFSIEADVELSPAVIETVNAQIQEIKRGRPPNAQEESQRAKAPAYIHRNCLRYRIVIEISPRVGVLRVTEEYLTPLNSRGQPPERPRPYLERVGDRIHLRMEGQAHPTYFECGLDHSILSRPHYPPHYPHLAALKAEMESWLFFYLEPRERMRAATAVKEVRHIGLMGEELAAFLNTLQHLDPGQFRAVEKALTHIIPSITEIRPTVSKVGEVELSLREADRMVPARVLSEGTLRLLGLLALGGVKEPPAVIGFEEPENGIHPRRIRDVAALLESRAGSGRTQLIVTTHSPILPDLIPDESLFVCRREGGRTVIEPFACWGALSRRSEIDAALEEAEERLPVSARMLRGDFDA